MSCIVPLLSEWAVLTVTRGDIHYVIKEHCVADLRGKSSLERPKALIGIVHPELSAELKERLRLCPKVPERKPGMGQSSNGRDFIVPFLMGPLEAKGCRCQ